MMRKTRVFTMVLGTVLLFTGCSRYTVPDTVSQQTELPQTEPVTETETQPQESETEFYEEETMPEIITLLQSPEDIALTDTDGEGSRYTFTYDAQTYEAVYTEDNWKIYNSYQIEPYEDLVIICEALAGEHPIHSADYTDWRTAEDMADEWLQHNLAYKLLSEDTEWQEHARDVDLNPADQGKSLYEMYMERKQEE